MNFITHQIIGIWKIKRKIFPDTDAYGYAKISINKNFEVILTEKLLTNYKKQNIFGVNEYLIKVIKKKLFFFFNSGPNNGKLFQKFTLNYLPNASFFYCLKDTYQTNLFWINKNYFRITHKIKGQHKNQFINTQYFKTNNINIFNKFI